MTEDEKMEIITKEAVISKDKRRTKFISSEEEASIAAEQEVFKWIAKRQLESQEERTFRLEAIDPKVEDQIHERKKANDDFWNNPETSDAQRQAEKDAQEIFNMIGQNWVNAKYKDDFDHYEVRSYGALGYKGYPKSTSKNFLKNFERHMRERQIKFAKAQAESKKIVDQYNEKLRKGDVSFATRQKIDMEIYYADHGNAPNPKYLTIN